MRLSLPPCSYEFPFSNLRMRCFSYLYVQDWEKHFLDAGASKPSDWNNELDGDWPAVMLQKPPYQVCGVFPLGHPRAAPSPARLKRDQHIWFVIAGWPETRGYREGRLAPSKDEKHQLFDRI